MTSLRRSITVVLIALAALGCRSLVGRDGLAPRIEALFDDLHARGLFDGAVVVGGRHGILFEMGYGFANAEAGVRFTPDTPADGGSLAKTFTAAAVLMLAAEGRLDLDQPARRLLPELPYPELTMRHLLAHSNGLPVDYGFFDPYLPPAQERTNETLLRVLAEQAPPLAFAPGSRFEYNNLGFDLAALAAARAAGTSLDALFRERLFGPLGFTSAFLRPGRFADWPGTRTRGYRRVDGRLEPHEVFDFEAFHGGSNVYLSARDLHRWNASFLTRPLLDRGALELGLRPPRLADGDSGLTLLSWYRSPDGSAQWYCGHLQGFHDVVYRELDTGTSIVYVSNNTLEPWLHHAIVRAVRALLAGAVPERLELPAVAAVAGAETALMAGRWALAGGVGLELETAGEALVVRSAEGVRYRAFQLEPTSFYVPGLDLVFGFARGAGGEFDRIRVSSNLDVSWGARSGS